MATAHRLVLLCGFFLYLLPYGWTEFRYEYNDGKVSWSDAKQECGKYGGRIAIIQDKKNYENFAKSLGSSMTDTKIWVGGRVIDNGWSWHHNQDGNETLVPMETGLEYKGCYRPSFIMGGIRMSRVSAERCFQECAKEGAIGLYSTMCLCEKHLRNLTKLPAELCDIMCTGNKTQRCGGLRGVSLYQENARGVTWGPEKFNTLGQCAYIENGRGGGNKVFYPATCETRLRYLCQFRNHEMCASRDICMRPSIYPATWDEAETACKKMGGYLAAANKSHISNLNNFELPPGKFWVALRRKITWTWIDGSKIPTSRFYIEQYGNRSTSDLCTVLQIGDGKYRLQSDWCTSRYAFMCQLGSPDRKEESRVKMLSTIIDKEVMANRTRNEATTPPGDESPKSNSLQSILFLGVGIISGIAFVFAVCVIVFLARRCSNRTKHKKETISKEPQELNAVIPPGGEREVFYDVPNELQNESPFRRTQRALRQGLWQSGSDGYRSNSWKRVQNGSHREGRKLERPAMGCEIRNIYPSQERSFKDTSYAIHKVKAQCHGGQSEQRREIDIEYTGDIDTRLRIPKVAAETDVTLAETYSLPAHSRRTSDNDSLLHADTADLYASVQKAMTRLSEDRLDQLDSNQDFSVC